MFAVPPVIVEDKVVAFATTPIVANAVGSREAVAIFPTARPIAIVVIVFAVADLIAFVVLFVAVPGVPPLVEFAIDYLAIFWAAILESVSILVVVIVLIVPLLRKSRVLSSEGRST